MPNITISANKRKLLKLFDYIDKGGHKTVAGRLFCVSRTHVYFLLAQREKELEREALNASLNPEPFTHAEGKRTSVCRNCHLLFAFPQGKNFIPDICTVECFDELRGRDDKDDEDRIALALAAKPTMIFPVTLEQKQSPQGKKNTLAIDKASSVNDVSDLIE